MHVFNEQQVLQTEQEVSEDAEVETKSGLATFYHDLRLQDSIQRAIYK